MISSVNSFSQKDKKDTLKNYKTPSVTIETNRAEERISPVTFSEMDSEIIEQLHSVRDLPQIISEMPSTLFYSESGNGIGYSYLNMRGFDQRRISVMINGIPQNDPEDHNFYWINVSDLASSLENIQVMRGAGLSSYGAAAIGGTINLQTSNFTKESGAKLYSGIGFQEFGGDGREAEATMNKLMFEYSSGLVDNTYSFYGKIARINSEGYRDHSYAHLNSYFLSVARFDENLTTQINIFGGSQNDGLVYTGLPKEFVENENRRTANYNFWSYDSTGRNLSFRTIRREQEIENFSQPQFEILNDWNITDNLILKSAVFFKRGEGFFDYDGTGWTNAESFRLNEENGYPGAEDPQNPIIKAFVGNNYGGWIPRLLWDHKGGTLMVGMETRWNRSERWGKIEYADNLPQNYNPDFKFYQLNGIRDIYSVFARETFYATSKLAVSAEAQLVYHRFAIANEKDGLNYTEYRNIDNEIVSGDGELFNINYVFLNPRLGATYNYSDYSNLYSSVAYTSRIPRMRNLYAAEDSWFGATPLFESQLQDGNVLYDFSNPLVEPEKMLNVELGWTYRKSNYYANVNFYWMEYFDELVRSGQVDVFGAPIDGNAPRTRHYGIELQGSATIDLNKIGDLTVNGTFTYSQNPIIEYNFQTFSGQEVSLEGNDIAGFPDIMTNIRLTYEKGGFFTSILMRHVGEFRTDNFGDLLTEDSRIREHLGGGYYADNINDAYTVFDLNAGYNFIEVLGIRNIKIDLQVMNLTNNFYSAYAIGKDFFPAAERNIFMGIEIGI